MGQSRLDDAFLTIYKTEGTPVGTVKVGDIASSNDMERLTSGDVELKLRHETSDREIVLLSFPTSPKKLELRVDVATAVLLDPKREIFPATHVYATAAAGPAVAYGSPSTPDCASAYASADITRVASRELVARAVHTPTPELRGWLGSRACATRQWRFRAFRMGGRPGRGAGEEELQRTSLH